MPRKPKGPAPLTPAERQKMQRTKQKERWAALEAENAALRAEIRKGDHTHTWEPMAALTVYDGQSLRDASEFYQCRCGAIRLRGQDKS